MAYETLLVDTTDAVATITLNRPDRLNAWTPVMGRELLAAFREVDRDRGVRVVVLTGAGRAFCSGADMDFFAGRFARVAARPPGAARARAGSRSGRR